MSPQGQIVSQRADRKYKEVHREEARIKDRERQQRPEYKEKSKIRMQTEEWKQANREAQKRYRPTPKGKANRERQYQKRFQTQKYKEMRQRAEKRYRQTVKGKLRTTKGSNKYRIKKLNLPGSHTNGEWIALCKLFDCRCVKCGNQFALEKLTRDHIIPVSFPGSSDNIENIQPLCHSCNSSKGNHYVADYRNKPIYWQQLPLL